MSMPRILVADDEEGIRESLNLILSEEYDLAFAVNGQETIDKLAQEHFDLVLLDIKMPKMDGLDVMRQLKRRNIDVPILILTAYQSVELAKEAINLGAHDYLAKPFEREQILSVVQGALSKPGSKQS